MIDITARREARDISRGAQPDEDTPSKVAFYGLVARALRPEHLPNRLYLTSQTPMTFIRLEELLMCTLKEAAFTGYSALSSAERTLAGVNFGSHMPDSRDDPSGLVAASNSRIDGGCGTAASIEIITLRTIARKQSKGETVSLEGLHASARVPLRIAMMHLSDLLESKAVGSRAAKDSFGRWQGKNEIVSGYVFKDQDVSLDPEAGLSLINTGEGLASDKSRREYGPQIGCPAMLISGYIKKMHLLATEAALEVGLLEAS